jgi:succinate-semialdehyde dehydrogenase/glutarate-semialdehyde dehydrogenase
MAHSEHMMQDEALKVKQLKAYITHQPSGPLLNIQPWNFPFWLAFKSSIPPLILGNPIVMKMAPACPLSALNLESLFHEAGFDNGEYTNVFATNDQCEHDIIRNAFIQGVKFTGSTRGGK